VHNDTPQQPEDSEYMTCPCGSRIKRKGFRHHTNTKKHMDHWLSQNTWRDSGQRQELLLHKARLADAGIVLNYWHI
jgi:hypothetical protein